MLYGCGVIDSSIFNFPRVRVLGDCCWRPRYSEVARFKLEVVRGSASFSQQSLLIGFFFCRKIQEKIISIYSEHIQRQGTRHSPCEFIIIPRLSQAQWIWNANELVRIKKSLWSETSPNLLQDESYTAMAYTPSLSLPEPRRYSCIYSPIQGHLHPHARTNRCPFSWNGNSAGS